MLVHSSIDAPKIQGSVTVYTWEGNAANISCEVQAHPSDVSMLWLRDGFQLPNANVTKAKVFQSPTASYLEVETRRFITHTFTCMSTQTHTIHTHTKLRTLHIS